MRAYIPGYDTNGMNKTIFNLQESQAISMFKFSNYLSNRFQLQIWFLYGCSFETDNNLSIPLLHTFHFTKPTSNLSVQSSLPSKPQPKIPSPEQVQRSLVNIRYHMVNCLVTAADYCLCYHIWREICFEPCLYADNAYNNAYKKCR